MVYVPSQRTGSKQATQSERAPDTDDKPLKGRTRAPVRRLRSPADALTRANAARSKSAAARPAATPPAPAAQSRTPLDARAEARKLATALRKDDMQGVYRALIGRSKADQRAIIAAFNRLPDAESSYLGAVKNDFNSRVGRMSTSHATRVRAYLHNASSQLEPHDEIYLAMRGWGTYETGVKQTLSRLHSRDIPNVEARFRQRYGDTYEGGITGALDEELSGADLFEAKMLLRGSDRVTEHHRAALELYRGGRAQTGTDETALFEQLEKLGGKDLANVRMAYREVIGRDMPRDLRAEMDSPLEERRMNGALGGRLGDAWASLPQDAKKARIDYLVSTLWSANAGVVDMTEATRVLGGLVDAKGVRGPTPSQLQARYKEIYGGYAGNLFDMLKRKAGTEDRAVIETVQRGGDVNGNPQIIAARLYAATLGKMGTDESGVCEALERMPAALRPKVEAAFKRYSDGVSIDKAIRSDMSDTPEWRTRALEHLARGRLAPERLAYHVSREAGEPEEFVRAVRGLSPEQRAAFAVTYKTTNRESLETALKRLPDREERAVRDMLAIDGSAGQVSRMQERTRSQAKREVGDSISASLMRKFGWSADFVDDAVVKFEHVVRTNMQAAGGRPLNQAQAQAISKSYLEFVERVRAYQGEKDEVGETAGDIAAAAAATIVTIASGGSAAPLVVAIGAASAAGAKVSAEAALKGRDYKFGSQEFFRDLAVGGVDGAVTVATAGLAKGATGFKAVAVETAAGAAGGAASGGVREGTLDGMGRGALLGGAGSFAVSSVTRGAGALVRGKAKTNVSVTPAAAVAVDGVANASPFQRFVKALEDVVARDADNAHLELRELAEEHGVLLGYSAEGIAVARGNGTIAKYSLTMHPGEPPIFVGDLALQHQAQALDRLGAAGYRVTRTEGAVELVRVGNASAAVLTAQRAVGIEAGDLVRQAAAAMDVPPASVRDFIKKHFTDRVKATLSGDVSDVTPTGNYFFDGTVDDFVAIYRGAAAEADEALRARAIIFDPVESSWESGVFAQMLRARGARHPAE